MKIRPPESATSRRLRAACSALAVTCSALLAGSTTASAGVALPGITASQLDEELKGQVLIEEMNCAACHASSAAFAAQSKKAPRLAAVGSRVNPAYIETFLRDPHGTKPGTTMPDLLHGMQPASRAQAATELTHFLLSLGKSSFAPQAPDTVAAKQGERLFHSRGCAACHSPRDEKGAETMRSTSVPLGALEKKYSLGSLVEFLRQPHVSRPSGRMPDLRLAGRDLECIAHYLLRDTRVPGHLAFTMYRGQVWKGLAADEVEPERGGHVNDFSLENFGKLHHHAAIRFEGWLNVANAGRHQFYASPPAGTKSSSRIFTRAASRRSRWRWRVRSSRAGRFRRRCSRSRMSRCRHLFRRR